MKRSSPTQSRPLPYQLSFQLGFTLIEIIIAITILSILTTIGIASFTSANAGNDVSQQVQEIKSAARRLRTDAMASRKPNSCTTSATPNIYYGTYLSFQLSANSYWTGSLCYRIDTGGIISVPAPDNIVGKINSYKTGLTVQALGRSSGAIVPLRMNVTFANTGQVYFLNGVITPSLATFTGVAAIADDRVWMEIGTASNKRRLSFNKAGLVCDELTTVSSSCAE